MQAHCGLSAIAASVLLCSGCSLTQPIDARPQGAVTTGTTVAPSAPATPRPRPTTLSHSSAASSPEPPFSDAGDELRLIARRFTTATVQYDARTQDRLDFLAKARPYTTSGEVRRLSGSPRTRLPWRVLRARGERVRIRVVGVSLDTRRTGTARRLVIEAIITTQTDFAAVRNFEQINVTVTRTPSGWRVTDATGAGL
jgi:hypothetical protein